MDRGAKQAMVYRVSKSWTGLNQLSTAQHIRHYKRKTENDSYFHGGKGEEGIVSWTIFICTRNLHPWKFGDRCSNPNGKGQLTNALSDRLVDNILCTVWENAI